MILWSGPAVIDSDTVILASYYYYYCRIRISSRTSTWQSTVNRCQIHHWWLLVQMGGSKNRNPQVQITRLCHPNACWTQLVIFARKKKTSSSCLLFKVVEGLVPAISPEDYLIPQRPKRAVRVRTLRHQQHPWFSGYQQQQMFSGTSIEERAI